MSPPVFSPASWNTDVAVLGPRTRQAIVRQKWKNYPAEDGTWKVIDCNFKQTAGGWEVTDAPFIFRAPAVANGEAYFESNVRVDIFTKTIIESDPFWMKLTATSASPVSGEAFDMNGNGQGDAIIYRGAFPEWGADLIYYVEHGKAPRLRKLIRFTSAPVVDPSVTHLKIPFDIVFSDNDANISCKESPTVKGRKWDRGQKITTKKGISQRPVSSHPMRGIGFKDFFVWDSDGKKQGIDVEYVKNGNGCTLTKLIPVSFFPEATFPVFSDLSGTFYPDPNTETTSVDGYVENVDLSSSFTWSALRSASNGSNASDSATTFIVQSTINSHNKYLSRGVLLFDTSALTTQAAPSSVVLSLWMTAKNVANAWYINLCSSSPSSNTALITSDYDINKFGSTRFLDSDSSIGGMSTGAYSDFTLNASGVANINVSGISKFGVRTAKDFDAVEPQDFNPGYSNDASFSTAEASGSSQDPKLVVTYEIFPAPTGLAASSATGSTSINLSWTDNSSDEDGFKIERSNDGSTGWTQIDTVSANVTTYSDPIGANSTLRYYRVRAYKGTTNSAYTGVASATTAPAAPSGLAAAPVSGTPTSMALSWTDNSSDETSFSIERSLNGSTGWTEVLTPAANATTATDTGLDPDTTYYYRIRAIRSGDGYNSNYSSNASGQTGPATPTGAAAVGLDATTTIRVTWSDVATTETSYEVERSNDGSTGWTNISGSLSADVTSYDDDVGAASTTKYYRIRAVRSGVNSAYSGVAQGESAPATPLSLAATPVSGGYNIALTWSDQASDESGYSIERSDDGATGWAEIGTAAADAESYTDTSIGAGDTTKHYRVRALRSGDGADSDYSNSTSAKTSPQAPSNLAATVSNLLVTLTWDDNASSETGFVLERKYESDSYATINSPAANVETYADPDELLVNHAYTYRLHAVRASDSMSSPSITLQVDIPPEETTNLVAACTVAAASASKIQLTWDINSLEETGFLVERSPDGSTGWTEVTTTAAGVSQYLDTGLEINTTYFYRVSAVGSLATSVPTSVVAVLTSLGNAAVMLLAFRHKTNRFPLQ